MSSPDKLVYMANQIGKFFARRARRTWSRAIATHIKKFWEPRMRKAIFAHLERRRRRARPECAQGAGEPAPAGGNILTRYATRFLSGIGKPRTRTPVAR